MTKDYFARSARKPKVPYTLTFSKQVEVADAGQYINDCCFGGDVVLDRLLPALKKRYGADLQANQEDWGWFAWFDEGPFKLSVDIFTEDQEALRFQVLLSARKPRFILKDKVADGAELDSLQALVVQVLSEWHVSDLTVRRVNEKYVPT